MSVSAKRPDEPPEPGWCEQCSEPCDGEWVDAGIGTYEFWGSVSHDHKWVSVSSCCGATILDNDPLPTCENCGERLTQLDCGDLCAACSIEDENDEIENTSRPGLPCQKPESNALPGR